MPQFLRQPVLLMQATTNTLHPLTTKWENLEHIFNPSTPISKDLKQAKNLSVFSLQVLWYSASCDCSAVLRCDRHFQALAPMFFLLSLEGNARYYSKMADVRHRQLIHLINQYLNFMQLLLVNLINFIKKNSVKSVL
jgi:hypothetical protein